MSGILLRSGVAAHAREAALVLPFVCGSRPGISQEAVIVREPPGCAECTIRLDPGVRFAGPPVVAPSLELRRAGRRERTVFLPERALFAGWQLRTSEVSVSAIEV